MARPSAAPDPAQPDSDPLRVGLAHPIVPVMACAFCARLLVLTARGWRHREGVLAATIPLDRERVQELRRKPRHRG